MKVKQLIEQLSECNPEAEVSLSEWLPPNYTKLQFHPANFTTVNEEGRSTDPANATMVAIHR